MFNTETRNYISTTSERDFVWVADYIDGSTLIEYSPADNKWNDFYSIDKVNLKRFGFIGHHNQMYFDIDGIFNLNNMPLEFRLKTKDNIYNLTGQQRQYNDIIQYKEAQADFGLGELQKGGSRRGTITQYSFGWKIGYNINGVNFIAKIICNIPFDRPVFFSVNIMADQNIEGYIEVGIKEQWYPGYFIKLTAGIKKEILYALDGKG